MKLNIYEKQDMHGQWYYTVDPGAGQDNDIVGTFELVDTDKSFELRDTDFGKVLVECSEVEVAVEPHKHHTGRFYLAPVDNRSNAYESRVAWLKRIG